MFIIIIIIIIIIISIIKIIVIIIKLTNPNTFPNKIKHKNNIKLAAGPIKTTLTSLDKDIDSDIYLY